MRAARRWWVVTRRRWRLALRVRERTARGRLGWSVVGRAPAVQQQEDAAEAATAAAGDDSARRGHSSSESAGLCLDGRCAAVAVATAGSRRWCCCVGGGPCSRLHQGPPLRACVAGRTLRAWVATGACEDALYFWEEPARRGAAERDGGVGGAALKAGGGARLVARQEQVGEHSIAVEPRRRDGACLRQGRACVLHFDRGPAVEKEKRNQAANRRLRKNASCAGDRSGLVREKWVVVSFMDVCVW